MVIELFGLPGSGKTTICDEIERMYKFSNPMNYLKNKFLGKIFFHFFLKYFQINKGLRKKYKKIQEYCKDSEYINFINKEIKVSEYLKYMIFIYYIENKWKKDLIIDEGIIHYCLALYAEFNVPLDKLQKIIDILNINKNKITIGLSCDFDIILYQIKKRNRKNTPIDFLEEKELIELLKKYLKAFEYFSGKYISLEKDKLIKYVGEKI